MTTLLRRHPELYLQKSRFTQYSIYSTFVISHIISYHSIQCHIISHDTFLSKSRLHLISSHIISYHPIPCHTYHLISYHTKSCLSCLTLFRATGISGMLASDTFNLLLPRQEPYQAENSH